LDRRIGEPLSSLDAVLPVGNRTPVVQTLTSHLTEWLISVDFTLIKEINRVMWVPVTTAWSVLGLRMEGRPPDVEGSCECTE
jgi:hypothetical protein